MLTNRPLLGLILAAVLFIAPYGNGLRAASTSLTKPVAVLDIDLLGSHINHLDYTTRGVLSKLNATMTVFENHSTPLTNGRLDIIEIRKTRPALTTSVDLKRHGDSSGDFPKRSYSLDLKKGISAANKWTFLGMPAEKEWILHSCWADKTCLRNVIGYWQAFQMFPWAPRTEFAEVFINGAYRGLYVAIEKVKLGPSRLNLPFPDPFPVDKPSTGAYIVKQDLGEEDFDWTTAPPHNVPWWLVSPKDLTDTQQSYIESVTAFFDFPFYEQDIDELSAADFIISQEMAYNADAYRRSMHITKYPVHVLQFDGLAHMGPIWDLDLGFGNFYKNGYTPEDARFFVGDRDRFRVFGPNIVNVCMTDRWRIDDYPDRVFPPLQTLWKNPRFRNTIQYRWRALRDVKGRGPASAKLAPERIEDQIDRLAARIKDARKRDDEKWKTLGKITKWECWNRDTFLDDVDMLKNWIRARIAWMDKTFSDPKFVNR